MFLKMKNKSTMNVPPDTKTDSIFFYFPLVFIDVHIQHVFTQWPSLCAYSFILFTVFNMNQ